MTGQQQDTRCQVRGFRKLESALPLRPDDADILAVGTADAGKVGKSLVPNNAQNFTAVTFDLCTERRECAVGKPNGSRQLPSLRGRNFSVADGPFRQHFTDDVPGDGDIRRQCGNIDGNV